MPKSKKPPPGSYNWYWDRNKDLIHCYKSTLSRCVFVKLPTARRSEFHDADLKNATGEINKILSRIDRANDDPSRHLSLIEVQGRLMLAWTHHGDVVGSEDDDAAIAKALRLKGRPPAPEH